MITRTLLLLCFLSSVCLGAPGEHLQPGSSLPAIVETDQHGTSRALADLLGPNGAILVVFRSADW
jgi:hypothetical protein